MCVATNQNRAPAPDGRSINTCVVGQPNTIAQHLYSTTQTVSTRCHNPAIAFDEGVTTSLKHDAPTIHASLGGVDRTTVLECSRKNTDRVALEGTQIQRLILRRLHVQANTLQATPRDVHVLPRRQDHRTIGRLNHGGLGNFNTGRNQDHIAIAANNLALHIECAGCGAINREAGTPGTRIRVTHGQCRCCKPRRVHHCTLPHRNARLVHQHDLAVARQRAKKRGGRVGDHAVDGHAAGIGLLDARAAATGNGKALPVDSRIVGASAILRRHQEVVGLGVIKSGLPHDRHTPSWIGTCNAREPPSQRDRQRKQCQPGYRLMRKYNGLNRPACTPSARRSVFRYSNRAPQRVVPNGAVEMVQ